MNESFDFEHIKIMFPKHLFKDCMYIYIYICQNNLKISRKKKHFKYTKYFKIISKQAQSGIV